MTDSERLETRKKRINDRAAEAATQARDKAAYQRANNTRGEGIDVSTIPERSLIEDNQQ
ncbi:hypothetical protein [Pseudomonas sp. NMI1173_11]|uniref:hypothetical protein n=1 Tax=Pseudomonas sp. NMI1173_11 TaxID=2903145 RepID=UPI001E3BB720|nr:hypothetical protein [Pseudomonas sp. NMI1173_11]MCE1001867.1 hypothetical protein [Pseudomonas sp. NMI1173_11]